MNKFSSTSTSCNLFKLLHTPPNFSFPPDLGVATTTAISKPCPKSHRTRTAFSNSHHTGNKLVEQKQDEYYSFAELVFFCITYLCILDSVHCITWTLYCFCGVVHSCFCTSKKSAHHMKKVSQWHINKQYWIYIICKLYANCWWYNMGSFYWLRQASDVK